MKILISHDVDHMSYWEHTGDLILPKYFVRSWLELVKGKISVKELGYRHAALFHNQWQHIQEIIDYNSSMGFKSTFFLGMNNGVGLNYPIHYAEKWIPKIISSGFEVGVHGINYETLEGIQEEYDRFKGISGLDSFGIRMHYLRKTDDTFKNLSQAGYLYDATQIGYRNPYRENGFWNFPIQIMDGWVVNGKKRYQLRNLEECKTFTLNEFKKAEKEGLEYLSILFHDCYFSASFHTWSQWYKWVVNYLKEEGHEFITHKEAILSLEKEEGQKKGLPIAE
ncbi:hypothetical protein KFE98_12640 [bacterium SCSIO 12741]|nr:hypothetical protein KFE98_12640 [bacterium SCSIO 12741]